MQESLEQNLPSILQNIECCHYCEKVDITVCACCNRHKLFLDNALTEYCNSHDALETSAELIGGPDPLPFQHLLRAQLEKSEVATSQNFTTPTPTSEMSRHVRKKLKKS